MLILHHPDAVNHLPILETHRKVFVSTPASPSSPSVNVPQRVLAHLVVRDLLQIKVGGVDHLHAGVAVVGAAESAPVFGVWVEPVGPLPAALQRAADSE